MIAVASSTPECISYYSMAFMSCHVDIGIIYVSNKKLCHNKLHPDEMKQCMYFFFFSLLFYFAFSPLH